MGGCRDFGQSRIAESGAARPIEAMTALSLL
jgi:hypothetical protein